MVKKEETMVQNMFHIPYCFEYLKKITGERIISEKV